MTIFKKFSGRLGGGGMPYGAINTVICLLAAVFFACEKTPDYCGDGYELNTATQFCFDGRTYDKCGGGEYNPANQRCDDGILKNKCSGSDKYHNPATEFCHGDSVYQKCGGNAYDPITEGCAGGAIRDRCEDGSLAPPGLTCDGTPATYTLTLHQDPTIGGTVVREPNKTSYNAGEEVTITATPAPGYAFTGWTGAATSANREMTVTMNSNMTLTANFQEQSGITTYTLTTNATPASGGTVERSPDHARYNAGTQVTVTATPAAGHIFTRWSGASTSTNEEITVTMNANLTLTAAFAQAHTLTVNAIPANGGTVLVNNTASTGATAHNAGAQVTVRAQAAPFYTFTGWSGSVTSTNATLTLNMNSDLTLTANFTGGQFNPDITYSSFTDERDGQTYRTVRIGNSTWMAENLNYANHILGNSWCNDNQPNNCTMYGRLYDWDAAMTACPDGWRLPDDQDWDDLAEFAGGRSIAGEKLKSKGGWYDNGNGTDEFGFSAVPGGYGYYARWFSSPGFSGLWWSASEYNANNARYKSITAGRSYVSWDGFWDYHHKLDDSLSARCVQN